MVFVLYMLGHVFDFWEQRWFIYAEGFKLLPNLPLLRFIDDVHFVADSEGTLVRYSKKSGEEIK